MTDPTTTTAAADQASGTEKRAWSRPTLAHFELSDAETANTNSNFDGINYSS